MSKDKNRYNTNHVLYVILFIISVLLVWFSDRISEGDKLEEVANILLNIGCGAIASVIVAWLIDIANCKKRNNELRGSKSIILLEIKFKFYILLSSFISIVVHEYPDLKGNNNKWKSWAEKIINLIKENGLNNEQREYLKRSSEDVLKELNVILDGKALYITTNIITESEYSALLGVKTNVELMDSELKRATDDYKIIIAVINDMEREISNSEVLLPFTECDLDETLNLLHDSTIFH